MRLPQKGNWVKIDSDNLGNFNPLVDNQFCRGVLVRQLYPEMIESNEQAQMDKGVLLVSQAAQYLEDHRLLVVETKKQVCCVTAKGREALKDWEEDHGTVKC